MPASKEFAILMEDRPGTLGKICRSLADRNVSILAFQSVPLGGKSLVRLFVDNPSTATDVLTAERVMYSEEEIAHVKAANKAGELARLAARLGDANININYAYSGLESGTNAPIVVFGVSDASIKPQLRLVGNRSPSHKAIRERPLPLPFFCCFSFYSCMGSFDAFSQE